MAQAPREFAGQVGNGGERSQGNVNESEKKGFVTVSCPFILLIHLKIIVQIPLNYR